MQDIEGLVIHSLRHTYASLAIKAGADVKTLQAVLGHASATETLDTTLICGRIAPVKWPKLSDRISEFDNGSLPIGTTMLDGNQALGASK